MSDHDGNGFVWFLAGLGLGALAGVLYAPRSGSETREALRARADEGREYVRNRAREAREQAQQWADRGLPIRPVRLHLSWRLQHRVSSRCGARPHVDS